LLVFWQRFLGIKSYQYVQNTHPVVQLWFCRLPEGKASNPSLVWVIAAWQC